MTAMDEGARIWLLRTARKNYWRVAAWYDLDDLIQDGFMCYARVIAKYERRQYVTRTGVVTNKSPRVRKRKHIMSLFKVVYTSHINDLANRRTTDLVEVLAEDIVSPASQAESVWDDLVTDDCDVLVYEHLIVEAPKVLQRLLRAMMTAPGRRLRAPYRVSKTGRETVNERLCRIAGLDPRAVDVATMLRRYLRGEPLAVTV